MSAGLGIVIILGVVVTVALGILKKLEVDVEGKFELPRFGGGPKYESEFDFEWELEKQKKHRRKHEEKANKMRDSLQQVQQDVPQMQRQPVPAIPSYYYPFYPNVGVPPTYPYYYW